MNLLEDNEEAMVKSDKKECDTLVT